MKQEQIICDNCGVAKKETNYWLLGISTAEYFSVTHITGALSVEGRQLLDLCGQKCAMDQLSKFLNQPVAEVNNGST